MCPAEFLHVPNGPRIWLCQSKEAQTETQCDPRWETQFHLPQEGFTVRLELIGNLPPQVCLNNEWKQRNVAITCLFSVCWSSGGMWLLITGLDNISKSYFSLLTLHPWGVNSLRLCGLKAWALGLGHKTISKMSVLLVIVYLWMFLSKIINLIRTTLISVFDLGDTEVCNVGSLSVWWGSSPDCFLISLVGHMTRWTSTGICQCACVCVCVVGRGIWLWPWWFQTM